MTLDVRCIADMSSAATGEMRCQLYIGHVGAHAVLVLRTNERVLRRWVTTDAHCEVHDEPFGSEVPVQLPWAPTCPCPVAETAVASRPLRPRNVGGAALRAVSALPVGTNPPIEQAAQVAQLYIA